MDRFEDPEQLQYAQALYDFANNAGNMPNLRLLILDASPYSFPLSSEFVKRLVLRDLLDDNCKAFPKSSVQKQHDFATKSLSPLFEEGMRDASDQPPHADLQRPPQETADRHWKRIHRGKHALLELWNGARRKKGLGPTEIRVAACRHRDVHGSSAAFDFYSQAESFDQTSLEDSPSGDRDTKASPEDVGIWADADVFSLVKAMPWLSYRHAPEYGCCYWSGELPRDNNPNAIPPESGGEAQHVIVPYIVKLSDPSEEKDGKPKRRNPDRQARKDKDAKQVGNKRQRAESTTTQEAGPSRT